jgi:Ca2+-dependent lipid-binding protein
LIQDPYCSISIGNESKRSRTCNGGGKSPQWSDNLEFNTTGTLLRLQVFDEDTFSKDDLIGEGSLNLNQFYQNPMRTENGNYRFY